MNDAFISYSWDSEEHEEKVLSFTNHLRKNGFEAKLDKMLSQEETATNFIKMMHKAMHEHDKVIVVLSNGYKIKAETFSGGVGEEYQLLLSDINKNPNKYVLVSFEGRSDDIIPFGLQGRDIVDLSLPNAEEKLFRKLSNSKEYEFAEVAAAKPVFTPREIKNFEVIEEENSLIQIDIPSIRPTGDASLFGNLYKSIDLTMHLKFRNASKKVIDGFAFSYKVIRQLAPDHYYEGDEEGYVTFKESYTEKIYPGQTVSSNALSLKVANHTISQILGSHVSVTVFTEKGPETLTFPVEDIIKIKPGNEHHRDAVSISKDLFYSGTY